VAGFSVVLAALIALGWPALPWPMAFDDLHLMRRFTGEQILASFHGQWDPERLMTRGLRPLSLLFNHVRTSAFGENVAAHRLLAMGLLAAYWALLVPVARRAGTGPAAVAAAGLLFVCSPYSVFHYVWITDGNHALQGLAFAGAAWLLCRGLERGHGPALAASLLLLLAGLLVREDTLAALPALLLVGGVAAPRRAGRRSLAAYAVAALALCGATLAYRARVVGKVMAPGHDVLGLLAHARRMLHPAGTMTFDAPSTVLVTASVVLAAATSVAFLALVPRARWRPALVWLAAAFFACTPGLNVQRDDLLLFPVSFVSLALATAGAEVVRARPGAVPLVTAALAVTLAGGAYVSRVYAENFHPQSLRVVWWNGRYLYGAYAYGATMPPERRAAALEHLASMGITNLRHHLRRTRKLVEDAVAENRRRPSADGRPFYPLLPWDED
jgi:hypothetical protein